MPRVEVSPTIDAWIILGTGIMTVTVKRAPSESDGGMLSINTAASDVGAQEFAPAVINQHQISNNDPAESFYVKVTGPGWILIVDT